MKKLFVILFLFNFSFSFGQESFSYIEDDGYEYEKILNYHVNIVVNTDSSLEVTETIKVNSTGNNISRGIFRSLPINRNLNNQTYKVKHNIISIKRDGIKEGFHKETTSDRLKIYIGKEDVLLSPAVYTYEIKYEINKQIGFFETYDELYWNVTGTDWDFTIHNVVATVHLPNGAEIIQNSCYTGVHGSKEQNCSSNLINTTTITWSATNLNSKEGLTIAVGFEKGIIIPPPPPSFLELYGITILLLISFLYLSYVCYNLWKKHGIDPKKPTVYPQFNPPQNLSPAAVSYYHYEKIKNNSITATLTYLAVNHFILIEEINSKRFFGLSTSKSFKLTKLRDKNSNFLKEEEKSLMRDLFKKKNTIEINGNYNANVKNALLGYELAIKNEYSQLVKEGKNLKLLLKPTILFICFFVTSLVIGNYINDNSEFTNTIWPLIISLAIPVLFLYILNKNKRKIVTSCVSAFVWFVIFIDILVYLIKSINYLIYDSSDINLRASYIFFLVGIVGLILMRYLIRKPAVEKLQIQSEIEGFKMYMEAAENKQIKFHNAPEITPEIFEKYLPYAIVFGVSEIWGEKFNNLLEKSNHSYEPNWYSGSSFDTVRFGTIIGTNLTSTFNSSSREPSQSSGGSSGGSYSGGSSSSGSSGGGSSGGGGGGGGGW